MGREKKKQTQNPKQKNPQTKKLQPKPKRFTNRLRVDNGDCLEVFMSAKWNKQQGQAHAETLKLVYATSHRGTSGML